MKQVAGTHSMLMSVFTHFIRWMVGLAPAETQTTLAEREAIARHARGSLRGAEIGVWHGVTTLVIREAIAPHGICFAIDPFPRGRLGVSLQQIIAQNHVRKSANASICWLRMPGHLAAADSRVLEAPIDFLFVDGDHTYEGIQRDWEAWRQLIRQGGVIALHDSRSTALRKIDGAGSVRYCDERIRSDPQFEVIDEVDSLTVVRRR